MSRLVIPIGLDFSEIRITTGARWVEGFLREALFPSVGAENLVSVLLLLLLRALRKIIDFCEAEFAGASLPTTLGICGFDFHGSKSRTPLMKITTDRDTFRDSVWTLLLCSF